MIRIDKNPEIPSVLATRGVEETQKLCSEYSANPSDYTTRSGVSNRKLKKLTFNDSLYGDPTVKAQLISDQHGKCCYCEAAFTANSHGDVEHFRPKGACKQGRQLVYPGYYWLAYDWSNLLFSCERCNRSFKKNEFPLTNEATRVRNHTEAANLAAEQHTLINPLTEDPEQWIGFRQHIPVARGNNPRAAATIKTCGLDRPELNADRLDHLNMLKFIEPLSKMGESNEEQISHAMEMWHKTRSEVLDLLRQAKALFSQAAASHSPFASMVRCNFPHMNRN